MQQTTFHSAYQADGATHFPCTHAWLLALYSEASQKKLDLIELHHIISHNISFKNLEEKINYTFNDKKLLVQSLMQSTFCYEMGVALHSSNERMEFLGDSLVNFIVGKNLYILFSETAEGDLSKLRGALVNEDKLAELSRIINLGENIFLGKGELRTGGAEKNSILADGFEALFAAIYFDSKHDVLVLEQTFSHIVALYEAKEKLDFYSLAQIDAFDSKSKLQELTMARRGVFPVYKSEDLPSNGGFKVEVWVGEKKIGEISGLSKKKIEKQLAKKIIEENLY